MEHFLSRVAVSLAAAVAALIFLVAAVGFLGAALYLILLPSMPAPAAALVVGLVGLVIAGLIILVARLMSRPSRTPDINDIATALGGLLARELTSRAQANPYRTVVLALLAGMLVGFSPELRKILKDGR